MSYRRLYNLCLSPSLSLSLSLSFLWSIILLFLSHFSLAVVHRQLGQYMSVRFYCTAEKWLSCSLCTQSDNTRPGWLRIILISSFLPRPWQEAIMIRHQGRRRRGRKDYDLHIFHFRLDGHWVYCVVYVGKAPKTLSIFCTLCS